MWLALLAAAVGTANPDRTDTLVGDWGGQGASLFIGEVDSAVQLGCLTGTIVGPYRVAPLGAFRWTGTIDAAGKRRPLSALFTGQLQGNVAMTLRVRLADGRVRGPYRLERFGPARLPACAG